MNDAAAAFRTYFEAAQRGDRQEALRAALCVRDAQPQVAAAHYALGEALIALGRNAEAAAAFARAVELAPAWPDAWVNLGLARYHLGGVEQAKAAMFEALRRAPGHAAAAANLGALMRITGDAERGEDLLRIAIEASPQNHAARLNLVAEHLQAERGAEALALLDGAGELPSDLPTLRSWRLARSQALLHLNRVAKAREEISALEALGPTPPEMAPLLHWRHVWLAQLEGDDDAALAAAAEMEAAIGAMGPLALPEHRLTAHYQLGRFWSRRHVKSRAFAHWTSGHKVLQESQPYSREAAKAFIDTQIATFDAARFAGERSHLGDRTPVFIVGMPRSGTTLCEQILASHAQVHGAGERLALKDAYDRLGGASDIARLSARALDAAAKDYLGSLRTLAPDKALVVDKMPGNEGYLGLVGLMLPGAKIVHCVRDPRDIGLSIWTYRFFGDHPYAHDLADLGWTIAQRWRLMRHWRAALPNPILTIALEDWMADFKGTLARLLTHLDLPPDPACARFYENDREVRTASRDQVRQPINARGRARWRGFADELAPLIAELRVAGMLVDE